MGFVEYFWGSEEKQREAKLATTPFKTKDRSCTDVVCLLIFLAALIGWIAVAVIAFRDGDIQKILYPTDSQGNICGAGEYHDRPLMMMFDITKCIGLSNAVEGCPTPSLCVEKCPDLEWSFKDGKVEELRQFCQKMPDSEFDSRTIKELISLRLCPAFLVQQKPLFDRCLPSFGELYGFDDSAKEENNTENIGNESDDDLFMSNITNLEDQLNTNFSIDVSPKTDDLEPNVTIVQYKDQTTNNINYEGSGTDSFIEPKNKSGGMKGVMDSIKAISELAVSEVRKQMTDPQNEHQSAKLLSINEVLETGRDGIEDIVLPNRDELKDIVLPNRNMPEQIKSQLKGDQGASGSDTIFKQPDEARLNPNAIKLWKEIKPKNMKVSIVLQSHDQHSDRQRRYLTHEYETVAEKDSNPWEKTVDYSEDSFDQLDNNRSLYTMIREFSEDNETEHNNTKRDVINLEALKEGVNELKKILNLQSLGERLVWDLSIYWWMLLLALLMSLLLSLSWIALLSFAAKTTVWISIVGSTIGLTTALAIYSISRYHQLITKPAGDSLMDDVFLTSFERMSLALSSSPSVWLVLSILFSALSLGLVFTLACCGTRIKIATEMISEASKAVRDITGSLLFPLLPFFFKLILVVWGLVVGSYLFSARKPQYHVVNGCLDENCTQVDEDVNVQYKSWDSCIPEQFNNCTSCPEAACVFHKYGPQTLHVVLQGYNLFVLLWSLAFVSAFGELVIAGAVSSWYWTFKRPSDLPLNMLGNSMLRTCQYHLGSAAMGSFLLALVQFARVVVEFISDKLHRYQPKNKVVKGITWCLRGTFLFLEQLVKYLNRNAFILTAMLGSNFCQASKEAFQLITNNVVRGFFVNQMTVFVMLLGKAFVIGLSSGFLAWVLSESTTDLHFSFVPLILALFGSHQIASSCFAVYSVAVDTLYLCFLKDIGTNDGGWRKPYYMSKSLMKIMKYENV